MEQQVQYGEWYEVSGNIGTEFIPADLVGDVPERDSSSGLIFMPKEFRDYCENTEAYSVRRVSGWGARLSAPGYLDCTEWMVFDTEQEALDHLTNAEENE